MILERLEITARLDCVLACVGCNHHSPFFKKRGKDFTGEDYVPWVKMLREKRGVHLKTLCFTGGEPFMNKGLAELINSVKAVAGADKVELFSNVYWLKDESSIDKYHEVFTQIDRFHYSLYAPVVDKIGLDEIRRLLSVLGARYPDLEIRTFVDGVVKSFGQVMMFEEPVERQSYNHCPVKNCTQLMADKGILYRCTQGLAIEANHPGMTDAFRQSKDIVYDIEHDTRSVEEWANRWPLDACEVCSCGTGREAVAVHVSDTAIRDMDSSQYKNRLVQLIFEGK